MDPSQPVAGRARGRGRGLYAHPAPAHVKDAQFPHREPYDPYAEAAKLRPKTPVAAVVSKHSSSEEGTKTGAPGRGAPKKAGAIGGDPTKRIIYPEARPPSENIRGKLRRNVPEALIYTRPKEITSKIGTTGQKITCEANYFRLAKQPDWNIYLYRVDFEPEVMDARCRRRLIATQREMLGGYLFDGTQIFISHVLETDTVTRTVQLQENQEENTYQIIFRLTRIVAMSESQSLQILNLILRRAMDGLHLETVGRNKFDADAAIHVPNLKLQIWPGYITSIRQHEMDILVCAEIAHKIMRSETVYDIIKKIKTESRDFKKQVEQTLLGATVLTKYNNKTYRIDEITYDVSPRSTFKMGEKEVSYIEYYESRYQIRIQDHGQPMLVSNLKKRDVRGGMEQEVLLVPELCQATGLTDDMRSNFRTMKELAQHTKIGPASRIDRLLTFNRRLANSPDSLRPLNEWNLALEPELVKIPARVLPYPDIVFGNDKKSKTNAKADWQSEFRNNAMFKCIDLKRWYVITPARAKEETSNFIQALQRAGRGMQFNLANPRVIELPQDTQTAVSEKIKTCANDNPQLIMCVVSNNQGDRYTTIKKRCYLDFGLPSQVIVAKTITPKDKTKGISGLMSVATKVAIQMNAKLGGLPWMISMPVSGLMTFGYDVCHDPTDKAKSWGALVATMDLKQGNSEFFTALNSHKNGEELSNHLAENVAKAVNQFQQLNGVLPERILFFRDGVGEGQIPYVYENEVVAVKNALNAVYQRYGKIEVPFLYMIVTKRVNTRIFFDRRNPDPGTCVDDVITFPERYDFYLVSQSVREGTVTPTGFNIIHDTIGIPPDRVQQLTFRFTYFYYNWSGTVRVPALCQYAHKLAFLASQSMRAAPTGEQTKNLQKTLYFL